MADGVRIQPQPARLAAEGITDTAHRMFIVRDVTRPLAPHPARGACRLCGRPHDCKTYHLQLDAEGTVMVSTTIWGHLRRLYDCGGFELVNSVSSPPAQSLLMPAATVKIRPAEF